MDNIGRLYSQVAAQAGCAPEKAMVACYLSNLSAAGKTMDEAAVLLRKPRCEVRNYARDWGIQFVDYAASPQPLVLTWTKPKRGRWELKLDDLLIASAVSDGKGDGAYTAARANPSIRITGSSARVAIERMSAELERRSVEIFGVDDVAIRAAYADGVELLAPHPTGDTRRLRFALAA